MDRYIIQAYSFRTTRWVDLCEFDNFDHARQVGRYIGVYPYGIKIIEDFYEVSLLQNKKFRFIQKAKSFLKRPIKKFLAIRKIKKLFPNLTPCENLEDLFVFFPSTGSLVNFYNSKKQEIVKIYNWKSEGF